MTGPLLAARDLGFSYLANEPILTGWHAEFYPGEMVAITGPSGTGKSTLLYLLGLMLRPDAGDVLLDGEPVASLPDARRADLRATMFGFVFQDAALDPTRTVADNIVETALYRGQPRRRALARATMLMDQFGVSLRSTHKPGQISGGQAQRIALCRALLGSPRVVLADEPTGNLDLGTATLVVGSLRDYAAGGATVIVVTHNPSVATACHRHLEIGL